MTKMKHQRLGAVLCALTGTMVFSALVRASVCDEQPGSHLETFDDPRFKDPSTSAAGWHPNVGVLQLQKKGGTFGASPNATGLETLVVGQGDWNNGGDGDGFDDLIGMLGINLGSAGYVNCHLRYLHNEGIDSMTGQSKGILAGSGAEFAHRRLANVPCQRHPLLLTGNFDQHSGRDLLVMGGTVNNYLHTASFFSFSHWDSSKSTPVFHPRVELKDEFVLNGLSPAFYWTAQTGFVIDWNRDGFDDVLMSASSGNTSQVLLHLSNGDGSFAPPYVILADSGLTPPFMAIGNPYRSQLACRADDSSEPGRGITALSAADFDRDGDFDIVIGSVNEVNAIYWRNDGNNAIDSFVRGDDILIPEAAPVFLLPGDYDGDGHLDLVVGRDGNRCNGKNSSNPVDGLAWFYNGSGDGRFTRRVSSEPHGEILNAGGDLDVGVTLDIDGDGFPDALASDGNGSGQYFEMITSRADVNSVIGTARSVDIDQVPDATRHINKVKITVGRLIESGTSYKLFVSNDAGHTWQPKDGFSPPGSTGSGDDVFNHTFTSYGARLQWRIELNAQNDANLSPGEAHLAPASDHSPMIHDINFEWTSVSRQQYSRSGIAYGEIELAGDDRKVLYSPSFFFPGYEGYLRAYDVTDIAGTTTSASQETIGVSDNAPVIWEAGQRLASTGASARHIFTSIPDGTGDLVPIDFLPTNSSQLAPEMGLPLADTASMINWLRGGMNHKDDWKFFDTGHSTPLFVGEPTGSSSIPSLQISAGDTSYDAFKSSNAARAQRVYLGANDGMLRSFNALTGDEHWAYIPYNLLSRMKSQQEISSAESGYRHQFMIDGALKQFDVYDYNSARPKWRTILISGQAQGIGRQDNFYYFAVDVTDPSAPAPLWEFTDPYDLDSTCSSNCPDPTMGQTWSKPTVGQVSIGGSRRFVVFVGSGYKDAKQAFPSTIGRTVYAIDAISGVMLGRWTINDLDYDASVNPSTLDNAVPGGVSLADIDADGLVDRVYFGDREGRFWKIEIRGNASLTNGLVSTTAWPACVLFDAGDPDGDGQRGWAPIITTPAIALLNGTPHVYFGTGGDPSADIPQSEEHLFYAVRDDAPCGGALDTVPVADIDQDSEWSVLGAANDRFWSDPVISNGGVVFFASSNGNIESADPCENLSASNSSRLFGRAIRRIQINGRRVNAGDSVFQSKAYLSVQTKIREAAVALTHTATPVAGETPLVEGEVQAFIQTFSSDGSSVSPSDDAPELLATTTLTIGNSGGGVRILRWRELAL